MNVTSLSRGWHLSRVLGESRDRGQGGYPLSSLPSSQNTQDKFLLSEPLWEVLGTTISVFIPHFLCPLGDADLLSNLILYQPPFKHNQGGIVTKKILCK